MPTQSSCVADEGEGADGFVCALPRLLQQLLLLLHAEKGSLS